MAATTGSIATNNCTASSWRIPCALDFTIPVTAPGSTISRSANGYYYRHGGVLPVSTAHPGDVRCGGRPHGRASAEGRRQTRLQHGVQAHSGPADLDWREDTRRAQPRAGHPTERHPQLEAVRGGRGDDGGPGQ